jgi:hypothetical protein
MSRKYRHQGYMDADGKNRQSRERQPPHRSLTTEEKIQRRSMRHAIDRDAREVIRCHVCGRPVQHFDTIELDTACPFCQAPLHCCRTCSQFDSAARWQCRGAIDEAIGDKNKANACAKYSPRLVLDSTGRRANTPNGAGGPREQFENLFKR